MGLLLEIPLAQSDYIQPRAEEIRAFAAMLKGKSVQEMVKGCITDRETWERVVQSSLGDIEQGTGDCFAKSATLCSVLRALDYAASSCFVIITCHYSENFGEATHATLLVEDDGQWYILDTTKNKLEEAVQEISSILEFTTHNRAICLFNDQFGLIAEGDGIIAELPELL